MELLSSNLRRGEAVSLQQDHGEAWPVFINEAAYAEKRIAFSLTRREVWSTDPSWSKALEQLMTELQPSGPLSASTIGTEASGSSQPGSPPLNRNQKPLTSLRAGSPHRG